MCNCPRVIHELDNGSTTTFIKCQQLNERELIECDKYAQMQSESSKLNKFLIAWSLMAMCLAGYWIYSIFLNNN